MRSEDALARPGIDRLQWRKVRCTRAGADVDDTERAWQEQRWAEEKALKHEELAQQQRPSVSRPPSSRPSPSWSLPRGSSRRFSSRVHNSRNQQRQQARSERISSQQFEYNEIVTGLASRAAAVQTNSMRGLTEYVNDSSNFPSTQAQRVGAQDAIATLISFIEDESDVNGSSTLNNYQAPQPVVVSRAIQSLKKLVNDASLGRNAADVSRGDFHGVALEGLAPRGTFIAVGADFRRANLKDLTVRPRSILSLLLPHLRAAERRTTPDGGPHGSGSHRRRPDRCRSQPRHRPDVATDPRRDRLGHPAAGRCVA